MTNYSKEVDGKTITDIEKMIGVTVTKDCSETVSLEVQVLSLEALNYQFVGEDGTKDMKQTASLEPAYDDFLEVESYRFSDSFGGMHYLSEFE